MMMMKRMALPFALIVLIAGTITFALYQWQHQADAPPPLPELGTVPEFSFLTQDSAWFTAKNLSGNITIADFIFTSCGGPCPLMSAKIAELQKKFSAQPEIHFLSFSVDPEYDTPSILKEYGSKFGANFNQWIFLTGDKHEIYSLARHNFHLTTEDEGESILHSTKFILIDAKGTIRGYYDYEDTTAISKLTTDVNALLDEIRDK